MFEVNEKGIYKVEYGVVVKDNIPYDKKFMTLVMPKEIFVEAYEKYILSKESEKQDE